MALNEFAVQIIKDDLFAGAETADVGRIADEGIADTGEGFDASFTESQPPTRELFNGIHRRISALARELIWGVLPWDTRLIYPLGALAIDDGKVWRSLVASNSGNEPSSDDGSNWVELLASAADTNSAVIFAEQVTFDKSILLKSGSGHAEAPINANDFAIYIRNGVLWTRTSTQVRRIFLDGERASVESLNLSSQSLPPNPGNTRTDVVLFADSSGVLRAHVGGSASAKRVLMQDNIGLLRLTDGIQLASSSSVNPTSGELGLWMNGGSILFRGRDQTAKTVADRAWVSAQPISGSRITAGTVTAGKLASNAVTTAKIADGAVTESKIADSVRGIKTLLFSGTLTQSGGIGGQTVDGVSNLLVRRFNLSTSRSGTDWIIVRVSFVTQHFEAVLRPGASVDSWHTDGTRRIYLRWRSTSNTAAEFVMLNEDRASEISANIPIWIYAES